MKKRIQTVHQFTAVFEEDENAGGYTVTIPELPGCISEGDSFKDALKNIHEAAALYLEDAPKRLKKGVSQRVILAGVSVVA